MAIASIRRRVVRLEDSGVFMSLIECPPLTSAEIEEIAGRAQMGLGFSRQELDRLQHHSPVIGGEVLMTAYRGQVVVKRYPGVDLSEI